MFSVIGPANSNLTQMLNNLRRKFDAITRVLPFGVSAKYLLQMKAPKAIHTYLFIAYDDDVHVDDDYSTDQTLLLPIHK